MGVTSAVNSHLTGGGADFQGGVGHWCATTELTELRSYSVTVVGLI